MAGFLNKWGEFLDEIGSTEFAHQSIVGWAKLNCEPTIFNSDRICPPDKIYKRYIKVGHGNAVSLRIMENG
jgi:hypothetical protein